MALSYAHPEVLVETQWVADHLSDPNVRIIEVDVDTAAYETGHIPGAVAWNWQTDLSDRVRRDLIPKAELERLLGRIGATRDTTLVLYGDNNNWFAAWAFWQLKIYGHRDARLMNGGRKKWIAENRPLDTSVPTFTPTTYVADEPDLSIRAFRDQVLESLGRPESVLVDVRSPREYSGELLAPENLPQEGAQRGGHIPGAVNIPWSMAVNEDGTFKSPEQLAEIYRSKGVTPDKQVTAYCRIGERSSHTWFVLKYLLGYPNVRNYDGSWTEWGSLVGVPIER
ncbi:MAG TPA: sulfurtransferase [Chloroflexota bacterium]|nr:sulfurtransferase [Chloroflexota bacterium]